MKALIAPNEAPIKQIISWNTTINPAIPVYNYIPNSCRVAQIVSDNQTFPVAEPMFWIDCSEDVVADQWYYDTIQLTVNKIVHAHKTAAEDQPVVSGTQTI